MSSVALVTGAAGGIGRATVQAFLDSGYDVAAVDAVDAVRELPADFGVDGARVKTFITDITDEQSVSALATEVDSNFGQLNTIALVAGVVQNAAAVTELDPAEFRKVMDVNLTGPFLLTRSLSPLLSREDGTITFISSWWGRSGHAYFSSTARRRPPSSSSHKHWLRNWRRTSGSTRCVRETSTRRCTARPCTPRPPSAASRSRR